MPENASPTKKKQRLAKFMGRAAMVFILSAVPGLIVYNKGVNVFHWLTRPAQHQTDLRKIDNLIEAIESEGSHLSTKPWYDHIFGNPNKSQKEIGNILENINKGKTDAAEKKLNELYRDFTASISNNKQRMDEIKSIRSKEAFRERFKLERGRRLGGWRGMLTAGVVGTGAFAFGAGAFRAVRGAKEWRKRKQSKGNPQLRRLPK